jgi:hypothetical protein
MPIERQRAGNSFLIVPNSKYFFGDVRNNENCLEIIASFKFTDVADVRLIRVGAICFTFADTGQLRSIDRLKLVGPETTEPEEVMQNRDDVRELQSRRVTFANFIAAALFGRICGLRHSELSGAQYAGMDKILGSGLQNSKLLLEDSPFTDALLNPKIRMARENPKSILIVTPEQITGACEFVAHLAARETELESVNLQACMVMNYQAAILHSEQHSAASLALNFAVAESMVSEIFLAYGLVGSRAPKPFANRPHKISNIPENRFAKMVLAERLKVLHDGKLLDWFLHDRLDRARVLRNALMHSAAAVTVRDSGEMQTTVRDLWAFFIDAPFELNASWSMRI